jgi:hypothetical protein
MGERRDEYVNMNSTHSVYGGLYVVSSEKAESVTGVDSEAAIQGLCPFPVAR